MSTASIDESAQIYEAVPGGPELLAWFRGHISFHDAEILSFELNRRGASRLKLYWWNVEADGTGPRTSGHATVTFELHEISDLELSGFSRQNVIGGLSLSIRSKDSRRETYYDFCATDADYHLAGC